MNNNQDLQKIISRIRVRENRLKYSQEVNNKHDYCIALLLDASKSMDYNNKLINAKRALKRFVDQIDLNCNNIVIVSFGEEINYSRLSNDLEYLTKQINNIDAGGCTPLLEAIKKAEGIIYFKQKVVLIIATDGEPSTINNGFIDFNHAKKEILDYIMPLKNRGIRFITIGIGNDIDEDFLMKVATSKNDYYHSEDSVHLNHIYQKIVGGLRLVE